MPLPVADRPRPAPPQGHASPPRSAPRRWRAPLLWCSGGFVLLLLVLAATGVLLAHRLQPMLRARLLQTFQERFDSPVSLDEVTVRYTGRLQVDGRGLRVQTVLRGVPGDAAHPMLQVQEFHFNTGLLTALSRSPRIHHVRIRGVLLNLPAQSAATGAPPRSEHEVDLEYAEVDDAHIRFSSAAPDRAPLTFDLPRLQLHGVSRSKPIRFHAVIDNGAPLGITETDGTIGPWNFDDPRRVPVRGSLRFQNKDMGSVRGLHGRLSMQGSYDGTVGELHAQGTTEDPAFALDVSSRPVSLRTAFACTLDAAAGRVTLQELHGQFLHSAFTLQGEAVKNRAPEGWRFDFRLQAPSARVEDVLTLGARTPMPVLRGALALGGRLQMRAGPEPVSQKLLLQQAVFHVTAATFSNAAVQATANELASRARGDSRAAKDGTAAAVTAAMDGPVALRAARLQFDALHVAVPGAAAQLHGAYSLDGTEFHFDGTVHTEAELSDMTGGIKHVLLKPLNGLFHHGSHEGATLPLYVEGTGDVPHFKTRVAGISLRAPGTK